MGARHIIVTLLRSQTMFDVDTFIKESRQHWPQSSIFITDSNQRKDSAIVKVEPINTPRYLAYHFRDQHMVSTDGLPEQAAEVAAWVRSMHPDPVPILWYTDNSFSGHTALTPGITPQEVLDNWVDHRDHAPYTEYPQYFH